MDLGKRIMIMGSSGSGKSTIATKLGELLNLPVVHLDKLRFLPGWEAISATDLEQKVKAAADQGEWIIDGNHLETRDYRLERADTVVFLDFSRYICLLRTIKRRVKWHGKSRPSVAEGCPEKLDGELVKLIIWSYPKSWRKDTIKWLAKVEPPKQVYHLKGNKAVKHFLREVHASVKE